MHCFKRMIVTLLLMSALARADTVYLTDTDRYLEGKVLRETDEFIILLVHNETGQIRIPRNKIKRIDYDIKTQLENLADDDIEGRYKVGVWAMGKGMFAEAIDLFESLKGKEGVGLEMLKLLAQAYEKRQPLDKYVRACDQPQPLDKALANYSDYLKVHPDDAVVAERIQALTKIVKPANGDGPTTPKNIEGLEGDGIWNAERWPDANPATAQQTAEPASGNKIISVQGEGGDKPKTAFSRAGALLNLTDSKEMTLRVFLNAPSPVSLAVAFTNAAGEFFESKQIKIAQNSWNKIAFNVEAKDFKAAKNNWQHSLPLEGKERISRIFFLVYGQRPFTLYVDSLFFTNNKPL
ncbi:MAG: hypothetical protein V1899_07780 [Planctomycetota bacterium]